MKFAEMSSITALAAVAALVGFSAQAQGTMTEGTVHFAADFAAAPNQFILPDGKMDGLNVDMCGAVAERMGDKIEWTNIAFPGLVPGLQAARFDAICTAIFINPDRLQIMNMISYVQWGEGLMVAAGNPAGVSCETEIGNSDSYTGCFDGLAGMTVSVAAGGTTNRHLEEQSARMKSVGLEAIDIRAFDSNSETIQAVAAGQADAAYVNDPQGAYYITTSGGPYEMAFTGFSANRLAIATLKDNSSLADRILAALEEMRTDGSYDEIVAKWGVSAVTEFVLNPGK
jgi:polar amino acid transport system substrate-binding protein